MWFQYLMEGIFKEMLLRGMGGKSYVVPPKLAIIHDPKRPWK